MLLGFVVLGAQAGEALGKTVPDPNHKGWTGKHPRSKQVQWKPIKTKCEKCVKITEQYNQTMQQLLMHRYWVNFWRKVEANRQKGKADPFWPGKGDINEFEGKAVGANLELMDIQNAQLEMHKKAALALERQANYLAAAIKECELTACQVKKPSKIKANKIGGVKAAASDQPVVKDILKKYGIEWAGPYRTKCLPCQKITEQLNALPGWVVRADMNLQRMEAMLAHAEFIAKSNKIKLDFLKYTHPDKNDYSELPDKVKKLKDELSALKQLFGELLKQLADCEAKYCPDKKSDNVGLMPAAYQSLSTCPSPAANEAINVGANDDVGSSANFREKAKKKAAGLATKAITNLLGIGGGGGGKSEGPNTYKDPVKNKRKLKVRNKEQKRDIRVGGVFTPDGLLISSDIKKAPGKGTFQTIYLENPRGWRLLPIRLWMYEIWRDWKLSVSWTRDTYVDGQLVKHEEGGWTESWRELIARGEYVEYAEVPTLPLWEQLGFNTAVSGARSLGTLFEVSPEMLAYEPINLIIHVTDPKKDPVVTVPYVFQLALDNKGRVVVEQVEETTVANSPTCTNGTPNETQIAGGTTLININDDPPAVVNGNENGTNGSGSGTSTIDDDIEEIPVTGPRIGTNGSTRGNNSTSRSGTSTIDDDIEEIPVTGSRIGTTTTPNNGTPATNTPSGPDDSALEEIEVTGSRISNIDDPIQPVQVTPTPSPGPDDSALEEIEVTGSRIGRTDDTKPITIGGGTTATTNTPESTPTSEDPGFSSGLDYGLDLKYGTTYGSSLSLGLRYELDEDFSMGTEEDPPTIYGEEIEDPPIVGIVLKNFDRHWIPRHDRYTFVSSKMYVPHPSRANVWIPHKTVKRKMRINFIARSNEKGKAMNADLANGPQDSPDLYFSASRNNMATCSDDPTGNGHFGTCITKFDENEFLWAINSDDYGGFSRLDVSCEGCVQLTTVAGVFPEAFERRQRWEVAVEEPDQEKRAVYVPIDNNKNQIADAYPPDRTGARSADEDNENTPMGNGQSGDGLSAYEEYRGFITRRGSHTRTDWDKKTLAIENIHELSTWQFERASGLDIVDIDTSGHENRVVNYNSGHANLVDQHGLILRMVPSLNDKYAGLCTCDLERPKGAERVAVKPAYRNTSTVAHELGHAIGMEHHGNAAWPDYETIRPMTDSIRDLLPGKVHPGATLCNKTLPARFKVGTKGDQGSGNHQCLMRYYHTNYVYEQEGGDFDCMRRHERSIFDTSSTGTGQNRMNRTAADASVGNCMSQIWINSK
ncbi:MAG: hypothetical protein AAF431_13360 [Pseudomonadota bacterium]